MTSTSLLYIMVFYKIWNVKIITYRLVILVDSGFSNHYDTNVDIISNNGFSEQWDKSPVNEIL